MDCDLRTNGTTAFGGLSALELAFVWDLWEISGGRVHDETVLSDGVANPHYHLRFRGLE